MKLISWNVNGIRAVAKKGFLDFVESQKPDILCLQETKAHKDQLEPSLIQIGDYKSYWSSATRKGYSGTVTYSLQEPIKVTYGIDEARFDSEGRFVVTEFKDFILYNVYYPNGSSGPERHQFKQEFLSIFTDHLVRQHHAGKKVIVVGDYNVAHTAKDVYDPVRLSKVSGFLPMEQEWFSQFLKAGFIDTFRVFYPEARDRYSWWSYQELARPANRGWRIDYICASESLRHQLKSADILDQQQGSDHCPVVAEFQF
jgi:exodeoxyribonuclease-3